MTYLKEPPKFLINPAAQKTSMWFPEVYQLMMGHTNPSYLNSLWLGTGWNLMIIPYRIARECLWSLFNFNIIMALFSVIVIPVTVVWMFVMGALGRLSGADFPITELKHCVILTPEQSRQAISQGFDTVLIDVDAVFAQIAK